jgi:glyoxylase-like metal-dependent hydrolase (beta-lactamase superfamily II)
MHTKTFYDDRTFTLTHLVWDEATKDAVVIDPVLDYDMLAVRTFTESCDKVSAAIEAEGLTLLWVLETHLHADHLTGAQVLKKRHGAQVAIGARITEVQEFFAGVFNLSELPTDGRQFDRLLSDGDLVDAGGLQVQVIGTPGHTPACVSFHVGDALFTGDTLFLPDSGTGRCDFPNGSARELYQSIRKLYALPDDTRVFVGHDDQPGGRAVAWESTLGAEKAENVQLTANTTEADYVQFRTERDATLSPPRIIFQSLQANVVAGVMPRAEAGGRRDRKAAAGVSK